ncbi:YutD-like domain-containing protein [Paenibacillus sp. NPDC058174]|uniref:YutD-like domain-containing protein n=1 Tax=Paenibacillus sp. NPDC058174 TaxID=3346366 RepID=UPI0036DBF603
MIQIGGKIYELLHENRNGWNADAFKDRYSEVLERYDFIIGDWGYNQLRLKGFFRDNHMKATKDSAFSGMTDYINEYCNFGCAFFVLEKTGSVKRSPEEEANEEEEALLNTDADGLLPEGDDSLISAIVAGVAAAAASSAAPIAAVPPQVSKGTREREGQGGAQPQQHEKQQSQRGPRNEHRRGYRPNGGDRNKKPIKPPAGKAVAVASEKQQQPQQQVQASQSKESERSTT